MFCSSAKYRIHILVFLMSSCLCVSMSHQPVKQSHLYLIFSSHSTCVQSSKAWLCSISWLPVSLLNSLRARSDWSDPHRGDRSSLRVGWSWFKHVNPLQMHGNVAAGTEHLLHILLLAMYELTHMCVHVHVWWVNSKHMHARECGVFRPCGREG
jgi:hypothetical protein